MPTGRTPPTRASSRRRRFRLNCFQLAAEGKPAITVTIHFVPTGIYNGDDRRYVEKMMIEGLYELSCDDSAS